VPRRCRSHARPARPRAPSTSRPSPPPRRAATGTRRARCRSRSWSAPARGGVQGLLDTSGSRGLCEQLLGPAEAGRDLDTVGAAHGAVPAVATAHVRQLERQLGVLAPRRTGRSPRRSSGNGARRPREALGTGRPAPAARAAVERGAELELLRQQRLLGRSAGLGHGFSTTSGARQSGRSSARA
jgi:hypothetical protein